VSKFQILVVGLIAAAAGVAVLPMFAAAGNGQVVILSHVPFSENAMVRSDVRAQCQLDSKVPAYIVQAGSGQIATAPDLPRKGRTLEIEIVDAAEQGNAFTGRAKSLTLSGELREQGKVIGTFRARRSTTGGFLGQYKGNCSFFHRCAKTLGRDVVQWLNNPSMNARLGD
jgi:hypothetical protein